MKKKVGIIASSVATIAVCASMVVGSTYALFTSEDKVDISVTAGKVEVTATVDENSLALTSMGEEQEGKTWANGGKAGFTDKSTLTLNDVTPGDGATFDIKVTNNSTVNIKYKLSWSVEGELADVLEAETVGAKIDEWTEWTVPVTENDKEKTVTVTVVLPQYVGNYYQGEKANITFAVEAVQGNAEINNADANVWDGVSYDTSWCVFPENQVDLTDEQRTFTLTTAAQFAGFAKLVNEGETFYHKGVQTAGAYKEAVYIVKLGADINLDNNAWTPISGFMGIFDGGRHTVSNLKVVGTTNLGLFGSANCISINNTRIVNAYIEGQNYVGALVGSGYFTELSNNYVENATIVCAPYLKTVDTYDGGAKAAVLGGFIKNGSPHNGTAVNGNVVKNSSVFAYRDLGSIIGCAENENKKQLYTVSNNTAVNVTLNYFKQENYQPYDGGNVNENIGEIVGRNIGVDANGVNWLIVEDNNVAENVIFSSGAVYVSTQETFATAIADLQNGDTLVLSEGNYTVPSNKISADNVTIKGAGANTVLDCGANEISGQAGMYVQGDNITIKDLTITSNSTNGNVAAR